MGLLRSNPCKSVTGLEIYDLLTLLPSIDRYRPFKAIVQLWRRQENLQSYNWANIHHNSRSINFKKRSSSRKEKYRENGPSKANDEYDVKWKHGDCYWYDCLNFKFLIWSLSWTISTRTQPVCGYTFQIEKGTQIYIPSKTYKYQVFI